MFDALQFVEVTGSSIPQKKKKVHLKNLFYQTFKPLSNPSFDGYPRLMSKLLIKVFNLELFFIQRTV